MCVSSSTVYQVRLCTRRDLNKLTTIVLVALFILINEPKLALDSASRHQQHLICPAPFLWKNGSLHPSPLTASTQRTHHHLHESITSLHHHNNKLIIPSFNTLMPSPPQTPSWVQQQQRWQQQPKLKSWGKEQLFAIFPAMSSAKVKCSTMAATVATRPPLQCWTTIQQVTIAGLGAE